MSKRTLLPFLVAAIGLFLFVGCSPKSSSVPAKLNPWERSRFEPGGGNAMVCYAIYGTFTNDTAISGATYRTAGIPKGVALRRFSRANHQSLPFAKGEFATLLRKSNAVLFTRVEQSPECLVIQGEVMDPANLNYLRDCVGMVTFFMDHGGVAVRLDIHLKLWKPPIRHRELQCLLLLVTVFYHRII